MPLYPPLKIRSNDGPPETAWKKRTARRLLDLRAALRDHIFAYRSADPVPTHDRDEQQWMRIATWNIREFDSKKYGGRLKESLFYIAEVISHFDLVAIQEVRADLNALEEVMKILNRHDWAYIATDVTEGSSGNRERMVFVYNKKKVWFRSIAGEVVLEKKSRIAYPHEVHFRLKPGLKIELPAGQKLESPLNVPTRTYRGKVKLDGDLSIDLPEGTKVQLPRDSKLYLPDGTEVQPAGADGRIEIDASETLTFPKEIMIDLPKDALSGDSLQFARSPFLVAFQSHWLKFILCTVHIYYGQGKKGLKRRNEEIRKLTEFLAERAQSENDSDADNFFFVLGDFNIVGKNHETWESLHTHGFRVPNEIKQIPEGSNVARDKAYDQIAYWANPTDNWRGNARIDVGNAGIFDYFKYVFRMGDDDPDTEDENYYSPMIQNPNVTYKDWRTYQMSDHLPMWIELRIDFGDDYLERIAGS